jgi:serine/threonine-protein kinase RsbW
MSDQCDFSPDRLTITFDRAFRADASEIDAVVHAAMQVVAQIGCSDGREHDIELALREALANAIKHGCKNDPSKQVQCMVACDDQRGMLVVVRDSGEGFDPNTVPSPVAADNLFRHHGRGIFLINQLMDEVKFERGGTEIHMRKRGPGSGASGSTP